MNDEERKALAEARGRVANLRAMFNKGSVQNAEPPAWKRRVAPPPPVKLPTATDKSVDETTNGQPEDRKIKPSYSRVKSSESLVDAAVQERKVRDDQERLTAQEVKDAMAKQSSYHLESDRAYNFSLRQQRSVRMAERMAKKSLAQFSSNGPTFEDEKREEKRRREEAERKKEQEAQNALRNFAGGKTFFEEQLDEKKRVQELERQQEQCAKEAKSNFSSPNFDHAYTRAKEVAQVEKEAEGKAKAALLKYDQRVVAHEYGMKNGMMVHKQSGTGDTPKAKRYPFTDPAARIKKPSPQSVKALARFQAQLAENRAREEQKASEEVLRKASWESMRKMSMESIESVESVSKQSVSEIDVEQLRASVDEGKLDVRSAAQKFAEMDRRAAEQAKQSKRPTTFNGVSYGRACPKEDEQQKVKDRNEGAKRIQSRVRGMIAREAFSKKVTASNRIAISIQTEFRRRRARKQFENLLQQKGREHSCAIAIQKVVRGRLRRNRYRIEATVYKAAIVLLQSHVRSWQAQTAYTKRIKAACQIQAFMARTLSGWHARNEVAGLRKQRAAATTIQVMLRMRAEALQTRSRRAATIQLQCAWRQTIARRTFDRLKRNATKRKAAQLDLENITATKIQSLWRGTAARSEVSTLRAEAAAAEAAASEAARQKEVARQEEDARRKEAARQEEVARELEVKSSMATKIQSHWRGTAARSEVSTLRAEAAAAEAAASEAARQKEVARQEEDARRKEAARQEEVARELEVKSSMATKIQSHWRGTAARSEVSTLRAEAAAAEAAASEAARQKEVARQEEDARRKEAARQEEVARELEVKSSMATKIQSHWRGMAARSEVSTLRAEAAAAEAAAAEAARQKEVARQEEDARRKEAARQEEVARELEVKSSMATKIQSHWRGTAARSEVSTLRAEAAAAEAAASEAARQKEVARQEEDARRKEAARQEEVARELEVKSSMATKIQSHWRGMAARSEVSMLRAEAAAAEAAASEAARQKEVARQEEDARRKEAARQEEVARELEVKSSMATKIQSHWRGMAARSEVSMLRAEAAAAEAAASEAARQKEVARQEEDARRKEAACQEEVARELEVKSSMATKIQSHWRGMAARSEVSTLRAEAAAAEAAASEAARQKEVARQEEDARRKEAARQEEVARELEVKSSMATKIQSHWRGMAARSEVSMLRAEAAAAEAAASEAARQEEVARQEEDARRKEAARQEEVARELEVKSSMATKIQSHWRGTAARSEVSTLRAEAAAAEAAASEAARQEEVARQEEDARRKEAARQEEVARELEVKSSMATKIQSHWRGMAARSEVSTLRAEAAAAEAAASEAARQEEVARQVEDARRKEAARQEEVARELEVKSSMATKIQSHWRGTAARSEVSTLRAEAAAAEAAASEAARQKEVARQEEDARRKEAARQEEVARELEVKSSMATKIQSHWRGTAARSEVSTLRAEAAAAEAAASEAARQKEVARQEEDARRKEAARQEEVARELEVKSSMATKIQSHWRGTAARSEVSTLRAEAAAAEAAASEAARQKEVARQEEDARRKEAARQEEVARELEVKSSMATKIQSHWRGMAARSEVSTLRAEAAAAEAAASEAARQEEVARQVEDARRKEAARQEEVARELEVKSSMATKIQSHWRGTAARSEAAAAALRGDVIEGFNASLLGSKEMVTLRIRRRWWRAIVRARIMTARREDANQLEMVLASRLQSQWRSVGASCMKRKLRLAMPINRAESEIATASKTLRHTATAVHDRVERNPYTVSLDSNVSKDALIIQAAWRGCIGRKEAATWRSEETNCQEGVDRVDTQIGRNPTLAELQLLSQTGRFSNLSDDSDDDSSFEDAPSFIGEAPFARASTQSLELELSDQNVGSSQTENEHIVSPNAQRNLDSRESTSSEDVALEYPVPEHHLAYNDDKSDASSDIFVDAIEEQKLVEHTIQSWSFDKDDHSADESSDQTFGTTLSVDAFTVGDGAALLSPVNLEVFQEVDNKCLRSSICESDRRLSFHSEYSYREPSLDSQTARGSLASSSLSGAFRFNEEARDGSFRSRIDSYTDSTRSRIDSYADSTRSRIDSYADSTRSRGDSYADSVRFRTDSHADMFRSRGNSLDDEVRSRGDSYADVSTKSYHDEPSFTDEGNHDDGPKIFDTDSDRASSVISDSPGSDKNIREVEKDEVHDEAQATRTKSNSRWRAASVLSALSSRRSSKPTSSPASSFEEEEKDTKVPPATTLPSITGLSSVAGLLNRKLSVPMSKLSTTSQMEMEESSGVYSPQEQQPSKSKFRFGRFAAPTVSKATFPSRFTWKSTTRRGTNEYDDGEVVDSQTA